MLLTLLRHASITPLFIFYCIIIIHTCQDGLEIFSWLTHEILNYFNLLIYLQISLKKEETMSFFLCLKEKRTKERTFDGLPSKGTTLGRLTACADFLLSAKMNL